MSHSGLASAKKTDHVNRMRAVAEQHGARTVQVGHDVVERAVCARTDQLAHKVELMAPATGVLHRKQNPFSGRHLDHTVGVCQPRCNRLFTQNCAGTAMSRLDRDVGMQVVRCDHTHDVRLFAFQQFPVVPGSRCSSEHRATHPPTAHGTGTTLRVGCRRPRPHRFVDAGGRPLHGICRPLHTRGSRKPIRDGGHRFR